MENGAVARHGFVARRLWRVNAAFGVLHAYDHDAEALFVVVFFERFLIPYFFSPVADLLAWDRVGRKEQWRFVLVRTDVRKRGVDGLSTPYLYLLKIPGFARLLAAHARYIPNASQGQKTPLCCGVEATACGKKFWAVAGAFCSCGCRVSCEALLQSILRRSRQRLVASIAKIRISSRTKPKHAGSFPSFP